MFNQQTIREKFIERKDRLGLSLRDIAGETGVSRSTLSRFQRGVGSQDADNLLRLAVWVQMPNLSNGEVCDGNTLENIKEAIRRDENLSPENKRRLWRLFRSMYESLREK